MQTYICIPYICTLHDFIWGSSCNTPRGFTQIYIWYCHFRHGTVTVSRAFTGEDCQYIYLFILSKKQQETWIKKSNVAVLCLILQCLQQQRGSQVLDESLLDGWTHQSSSAKKVSLNITHAKKRVASSVKQEVPDVLPVKKPVTQFEVCSFNHLMCVVCQETIESLYKARSDACDKKLQHASQTAVCLMTINTIQDGGGRAKRRPVPFPPVTSTNIRLSPQNFLTFSFNRFITVV